MHPKYITRFTLACTLDWAFAGDDVELSDPKVDQATSELHAIAMATDARRAGQGIPSIYD